MSNITATAQSFFDACETGKAWAECQQYCTPNATFSSQANPLLNITTLSAYCDWMRDVLTGLTDVSYEVKSFATDATRHNVAAFGVFYGTHLVDGLVSPTGKKIATDYVYVMQFNDDKISHMTKIWHA
jgi:ketosteroid isomerase-like protein